MKQPRKPWNEQAAAEKIGTVITTLLGLGLIVGCIVLGVQAVQQSNAEDAQANASATADAVTETVQALTPTPTPTFVHRITDIVTHHRPDGTSSSLNGVITGATQNGSDYRVDVTESEPLGAWDARIAIQADTYDILDALYASSLHPTSVTVRVFGPVMDKYGNTSNGQWAVAVLTEQTEEKFNWKGLSYRSAWAVYDQAEYLVNGL
jgi:hypothetical protein